MMSKKMLGLMVAFAVVVAACGSSSASKAKTTDTSTTTTTTTTGPSTDPTSATLQLVSTTLGKVVADSDGKVLYLYVPDGTSTESKVPAGLLVAWPPLKATGVPTLGPGLTAKSSTGTQPNGEKWVLYNGHLLYGFTGDPKAGDVNGNGLSNIWYAVTAAGGPVQS
jgi:predicted lipoprotein with Yx(FWY)xxD motif